MTNFKRCSTAAALLMATAFPAFAQDAEVTTVAIPEGFVAPEGSILLTFTGDEELYVVPYATAAEFCDVSSITLESLAEAPQTEVIYCDALDQATLLGLVEDGTVTPMSSFEDSDDDDDDGDFGDDAEETAADEANDADGDGIFDEDDNDQDDDDGLINDDDAGTDDDVEGEDAAEDATDDNEDSDSN